MGILNYLDVLGGETYFDMGIMVLLLKKCGAQPAGPRACIASVIQGQ